jgi:FdhD protein
MKMIGQVNSLPVIEEVSATRLYKGKIQEEPLVDPVIVEHLLEIVVDDKHCNTLSCSPEHLIQLVVGHLVSQGRISGIEWINTIELSKDDKEVKVTLIAGETLMDAPLLNDWSLVKRIQPTEFNKEKIFTQAKMLYDNADWFFKTGAAHSSSLAINGITLYRFADISRHNTIDKLIGQALIDGADLTKATLFTSGRIPLDMISKVARCGIPIVCSRSAPTTAAIDMAKKLGITLIGFVREERMNVYHLIER